MEKIRIRGARSDWKKLPATKSLFNQPLGQGIVIGNLTSQLLSNIFMDVFDRFVKYELQYSHYGRYVDDFYIIVPREKKEILLADVRIMERFLSRELALVLHPKKRHFQDVRKGMDFVGAVVYPRFKVPSKRVRRRYRQSVYELATRGEGEIEGVVARAGCMRHLDSWQFLERIDDELGWSDVV